MKPQIKGSSVPTTRFSTKLLWNVPEPIQPDLNDFSMRGNTLSALQSLRLSTILQLDTIVDRKRVLHSILYSLEISTFLFWVQAKATQDLRAVQRSLAHLELVPSALILYLFCLI